MSDFRYPYVNTGEVLDAPKTNDTRTFTRSRIQFEVKDGAFTGSVILTVKAFRNAVDAFSRLNAGDLVEVHGHIRWDAPREEYAGGIYLDGREVTVTTLAGIRATDPGGLFESTPQTAEASSF